MERCLANTGATVKCFPRSLLPGQFASFNVCYLVTCVCVCVFPVETLSKTIIVLTEYIWSFFRNTELAYVPTIPSLADWETEPLNKIFFISPCNEVRDCISQMGAMCISCPKIPGFG